MEFLGAGGIKQNGQTLDGLTAAGVALAEGANAGAQRTALGLAIGSDVQAYDVKLASIASLGLTGKALQVLRVNSGETGYEHATASGGVPATYDAIGGIVAAATNSLSTGVTTNPGDTVAGSTLVVSTSTTGNTSLSGYSGADAGEYAPILEVVTGSSASLSLTGTWRALGRSRRQDAGTYPINLWLRIA